MNLNEINTSLHNNDINLWSYLKTELTRGYNLDQEEDKYNEKQRNLYRLLNLPLKLEKVRL